MTPLWASLAATLFALGWAIIGVGMGEHYHEQGFSRLWGFAVTPAVVVLLWGAWIA